MTLILTYLTRGNILQVSDRKLSPVAGGTAGKSQNKVVAWCKHTVFAYTGLASMIRSENKVQQTPESYVSTPKWLGSVLRELQPNDYIGAFAEIAKKATDAFNHPKYRAYRGKYHEFVVASWVTNISNEYCPFIVHIKNSDQGNNKYRFVVDMHMYERAELPVLICTGFPVPPDIKQLTEQKLKVATARKENPEKIAKF